MHILVRVTVEDLIEALLAGNLDRIVTLRQRVDDSDEASAPRERADAVAGFVLPPGHGEVRVPLGVRLRRRHVQEAPLRAHELRLPCRLIDVCARSLGRRVKPMGDIGAGCEDYRVALGLAMILIDQEGQVVDSVEEGHPDVARGVVSGDFLWRVEASKFVGSGHVLGLLDARGARFAWRWDSCSHMFDLYISLFLSLCALSNRCFLFNRFINY